MNVLSKVSFVIPVYNCEKYLSKCVEGIKKISAVDYEIILVDDGSKDRSGLICDRLSSEDARISCIHQENRGVSSARNAGLKAATGDYVCFIDSDDEIESSKLDIVFEKLKQEKSVDMAIFGLSFDYYHKERLYRQYQLSPSLTGIISDDIWLRRILDLYTANALNSICNKIFLKEFLKKHNLYLQEDMFLYEDLEYFIRCMGYCKWILFEPEIIYHYRQSEKSGNMGRHLLRIEHIFTLLNQIEKSFYQLIENKKAMLIEKDVKKILLSLYLIFAREKIDVSNSAQIRQICEDFEYWYQSRAIEIPPESQKYVKLLLKKAVKRLIMRREYIKIRHKIAVKVKNTRIYQKLKG